MANEGKKQNWKVPPSLSSREQPQEPSRMVTEVSAEQPGHFKTVTARVPASEDGKPSLRCNLLGVHGLEHTCVLTEASEGGEKPQCPHDEIDGEGRCRDCREPATPAQGAPPREKGWLGKTMLEAEKHTQKIDNFRAASPRSGMGAREFAAEHVEWLQRITPTGSSKTENDPFAFAEAYAAEQVRQAADVHLREVQELQNRVQYLRFGDPTRQSKGAESMSDGGPDNPASGGHSSECASIPELQAKVAELRQEAEAATNDLMRISKALNQPGTQLVPIADRAIEAIEELRQERDDDEQMWRERCDAASKAGYEVAMEQERESRERAERALREMTEKRDYLLQQLRNLRGGAISHYAFWLSIDDVLEAQAQVKSSESTK